jgi:SAM-dependent methyltransferase
MGVAAGKLLAVRESARPLFGIPSSGGRLIRFLRSHWYDVGLVPAAVAIVVLALRCGDMDVLRRHARRLNPGIPFAAGDVLRLGAADAAFSAVTAFYCICNLPREDLATAFTEMRRVLRPGGAIRILRSNTRAGGLTCFAGPE